MTSWGIARSSGARSARGRIGAPALAFAKYEEGRNPSERHLLLGKKQMLRIYRPAGVSPRCTYQLVAFLVRFFLCLFAVRPLSAARLFSPLTPLCSCIILYMLIFFRFQMLLSLFHAVVFGRVEARLISGSI
jgi:hypothetical protein